MTPNTPRQFTSNPAKFLAHPAQLESFRRGTGYTAIATHLSMTGACNLSCGYCAYSKRDRAQSIPLPVLKDYVKKLMRRRHGCDRIS
jgi:sulfatase maturation enzyme AslB (radical SAM superfamily)